MMRLYIRSMAKMSRVKTCNFVKPARMNLVAIRYLTHHEGLPRLPLPTLQQTCQLYLSFLEPIVKAEELKHTKQLLEEFQKPGGVGERLQRGLERRARNMENWLTDYSVRAQYLDNRMSVVVNSNIGCVFPRMDFRDKKGQIRCAAKMIAGILDVKAKIDNETLPVEHVRGRPLCMKQYYQLLPSCRIPGLKKDSLVYRTKSSMPPRHITVVHNSQLFVLDVYHSDDTPLTTDQLCVQLEMICNSSLEKNPEPVGLLTAHHRDPWGKAYVTLMKDKTNKESLSAIQSCICTVCLDGEMPPVFDKYNSCAVLQMLHGGGSQWNSGNRWFDNSMQLIIGEDGTCGTNCSHAPVDGTVYMALIDYVVEYINRTKPEVMQPPMMPLPKFQKLQFNIPPEIKRDIEEAKHTVDIMAQYLDAEVLVFDHFGKNVPKTYKISPDAFVQMALQLAYFRIHQRCCASEEYASLRMFRDGRVGTVRSTSSASAAFVKVFDDPLKQNMEKMYLLEKAIEVHAVNSKMTMSGHGIDGHLLGLKMQAAEENIPLPEIFTDTSYLKALDYGLCTSQVTSKTGCLPCVGPDKLNEYDVCYSLNNDHITFIASAFNTCSETNAVDLMQAVGNALLDMRMLLEQTSRAKMLSSSRLETTV